MARGTRSKVRAHRDRLRAQGLRPVQIRVSDLGSARLAAEAHRQSLSVAQSRVAGDEQAYVDAISLGA